MSVTKTDGVTNVVPGGSLAAVRGFVHPRQNADGRVLAVDGDMGKSVRNYQNMSYFST